MTRVSVLAKSREDSRGGTTLPEPSDADLIQRTLAGERDAFELVVRRYQDRAYWAAAHLLGDAEEARDVAQEAFLRAYRALARFDFGMSFYTWLYRIVVNLCIDHLRRRKARPPVEDLAIESGLELEADGPTPEEASDEQTRRRLLYRALDGMKEDNREIILLKDIQGLKLEEIARMLALPIGTVKSRSNRARIELAKRVVALDPAYGSA